MHRPSHFPHPFAPTLVRLVILPLAFLAFFAPRAAAQEPPYFVTYSAALEEPGNLEVSFKNTQAAPRNANPFLGTAMELEYGVKGWWTTEFYLDGQATLHDSTILTGFRWAIASVRCSANTGSIQSSTWNTKTPIEPIAPCWKSSGTTALPIWPSPTPWPAPRSSARCNLEAILSSNYKGWNFSDNFISEKSINESEPWEFGYALGASRPLSLVSKGKYCFFCRQNFAAGLELYGGLGTTDGFGWKQTSQYLGPTGGFGTPHNGPTIFFSPQFGLNDNSAGVLYRFGISYEIQQVASLFHRKGQ